MGFEEQSIQMSLVLWMRTQFPGVITIISPIVKYSGSPKQRMLQGMRQKKMGYTAGTPDLFIAEACGQYHGLFIELKTKKGSVSDNQYAMQEELQNRGYKAEICYGLDDAMRVIGNYFLGGT